MKLKTLDLTKILILKKNENLATTNITAACIKKVQCIESEKKNPNLSYEAGQFFLLTSHPVEFQIQLT